MRTSLEESLRIWAGRAGIAVTTFGVIAVGAHLAGYNLLGISSAAFHGSRLLPALCGVFGGFALWLLHAGLHPRKGLASAAAILALAAYSVTQFLAQKTPLQMGTFPFAALVDVVLAIALAFLAQRETPRWRRISLWLAGIVLSFSGALLFIQTLPSSADELRVNLPGMPFNLAALVLAGGIMLAQPDDKFVRLFSASTSSGLLARRLFFGAVLVPAVLSRLFILLVLKDVVRLNDGVLLLASMILASGFIITMLSSEPAVTQDEWRARADEQRRQLTARLEQQAAQLQEMVAQRTRELNDANAGLRAAAESNARLALVANYTTNGVIIADAEGRIDWCNAAFERLTGYTLPEIKGRKPGQFLRGPGTDPTVSAQLRHAVTAGEACKVEILNYTKNGRPFWQVVDLEPVRDQTGRVINYISLQIDISEQRLAQQRLLTLNQRLELATRATALGVWEWDHAAQRFYWDDRMHEIHGIPREHFNGTFEEWSNGLHAEDRPQALAAFEGIISGANEYEQTFRLVRTSDDAVRHVEARGIVQRDSRGQLLRITGTCRDITATREATQQLAALNERLKLALSSSSYGVWELDLATMKMSWDDRMLEIYQVRREEFDGSRMIWETRVHPEDRTEATELAFKVIAGDAPRYATKFRIVMSDGSLRHIEAHGYLQRDTKGKPVRLVGLNRDITAETQVFEALAVAEERWQLAIEGTNDAVWDWNIQTGVVFHDERWGRMLGYTESEMDRSIDGWRKLTHPEDLPANAIALDAHFSNQSPFYRQELRVRAKNGEWRWVLDRGKVVARTADGKPLRMAGTHTDITERKRLEERLRRMEDLATQVSELAQIGGWELHLESNQLTWSRVVHELFGLGGNYTPTLRTMLDLFLPESRETLEAALNAASRSAAAFDLELPATSASGNRIWVRVIGKPEVRDRRTVSIQGAMQDITARHESEEARHQLEVQLFQAQKMETLGTLAGGIAHDFNNLLTGIIGYHELAADSIDKENPAHAMLTEARGASLRARELVEQILTFSRQSAKPEHAPVDLAMVVDEARRLLRATVPASIAIETDVVPDRFRVLADATQIHQVVLNLASNAAHAMRTNGGTLKISLGMTDISRDRSKDLGGITPGNYVRLTVTDTGHGMDLATLRRIFDPFFTTKGTREGTGLGLAVVHGIVRAHRGAIDVESQPGVGSTFHVFLPAAIVEEPEIEMEPETPVIGSGERICIVDDEAIVGSCTRMALGSKGYEAVHYSSGSECLTAIMDRRIHFDLLLTDQTMPGMQGTELAAKLRKLHPNMPIVIMSGYFSKISPEALDELGPVELLAKPFTTEELAAAIDRALHGKVAQQV